MKFKPGDIWDDRYSNVILHCISEDARMGKGFAEQVQTKYPEMVRTLVNLKLRVGQSYVTYDHKTECMIINLVTKRVYNHKPTQVAFENAVISAKEILDTLSGREVIMPFLGTGLDKLKPQFVIRTLEEYLYSHKPTIYILELDIQKSLIRRRYNYHCPTCDYTINTINESECPLCKQKLLPNRNTSTWI